MRNMIVLIALQAFCQAPILSPPEDTLDLSLQTRPFVELSLFKSMPTVSANEYRSRQDNSKKISYTRVYRFSYKARFSDEVKRWQTEFPGSGGWLIEESKPEILIISRPFKTKQLHDQALILHPGRIEFDMHENARTKVITDPESVWVSFNENLNAGSESAEWKKRPKGSKIDYFARALEIAR